jgi:hypothetical protein
MGNHLNHWDVVFGISMNPELMLILLIMVAAPAAPGIWRHSRGRGAPRALARYRAESAWAGFPLGGRRGGPLK